MCSILLAATIAVPAIDDSAQPAAAPPKRRIPSQVVGFVGYDNATRVLNLLGKNGIPATADGPFLYYEVKVPLRDARRARKLLRALATTGEYWLQPSGDNSSPE